MKNNLAVRNWNRSKLCAFCRRNEIIQHIFLTACILIFLEQSAVYFVLGLKPPGDIHNFFNEWYKQGGSLNNSLVLIGGAAIYWTICWLTRNEVVSLISVNLKFFCRYCLEEYIDYANGQLQLCENDMEQISQVCRAAMNFFVDFGCRSNFRMKL